MTVRFRRIPLAGVFVGAVLFSVASLGTAVDEEEQFTEELLLRPLPDRKALAHFHFGSSIPASAASGHHLHLFPKAIAQLAIKFHVKELELSFTQGRWNYELWGGCDPMVSRNAKPPGVELWATFDLPINEIDATWKSLTHALSGLFCASINYLEPSTEFTTPVWGFRMNDDNLRYGTLPREAVCTENLTPWLKLLPCRDKAGIASLLDRPSIYRGYYHSQRLRVSSDKSTGVKLEQTLTAVLQPNADNDGQFQPNWSLTQLFTKSLTGTCTLAKSSRVYIEIDSDLANKIDATACEVSSNPLFELSASPDSDAVEIKQSQERSASILYEYNVAHYSEYKPLDAGIIWKLPVVWNPCNAPYHTTRFLMGSGNERGSVAIMLQQTESHNHFFGNRTDESVYVTIFQVVPWYVKVYYHTLEIFLDGKRVTALEIIENIKVTPSEDKLLPGTLEMLLKFPCTTRLATLAFDFDKGFLHIDDYPPDAYQGFDIPSALVSFRDFHSRKYYHREVSSNPSPLLQSFEEEDLVKCYTEVLVIPLTTPDFSMPYNVITFTCTVLALYFGSMVNVMRRRIGEEERLLRSKAARRRGLIPLIVSKLLSKLRGQRDDASHLSPVPKASRPIFGRKQLLRMVLVASAAVLLNSFLNQN